MEKKKLSIFVFGLSKAGKTTLIEYFRQRKFIPQSPTIGVSISQIIFQKLVLDFTDVGGQDMFRKQWDNYLKKPHILVFVIDGVDRDTTRMQTAKMELQKMIRNPKVVGAPLLVLINKVDDPLCMSKKVVEEKYDLVAIKDRDVATYPVSAMTGNNIDAVLNAMTSMVLKDEAIEYFVNEQVKQQSRNLLGSYKEFLDQGNQKFKEGSYSEALAMLNLAKEISSNLFQLGVISSGKEYQKLTNTIAKVERALDKQEALKQKQPVKSYLTVLKEEAGQQKDVVKTVSIFLFGLDRAGKTTFVEYLKNEQFKDHAPTLGMNISNLVLGNVRFNFNDLGGQQAFRETWMDYWTDQTLMIFMVDSADAARFQEAKQALWGILNNPRTRGTPLLVLVNKLDLPMSKPRVVVESAIDYHAITRPVMAIHEISVKNGYNLDKALNFIVSLILKDNEMERFVSKEIKRLIKNYKEMYKAYVKEAKVMEKKKDFQTAYNRVYKARMIQEELFKHGWSKAAKKMKKCDNWLNKLQSKAAI